MTEEQIAIEGILHVPIGAIAKYRPEQLYRLLAESADELERVKRIKQWIEAAVALKYEERVIAKRLRLEKDTGIIHLEDGGFKISSDVPKKVDWNQQKLARIAADIVANGGNLADYVEACYNVRERSYNNWPSAMRAMFEPARVMKLGKAVYKLSKLNDETKLDDEAVL